MSRLAVLVFAPLLVAGLAPPSARAQDRSRDERAPGVERASDAGSARDALAARLAGAPVQGASVATWTTVRAFYAARRGEPAWTSPDAALPVADALVAALHDTAARGLEPDELGVPWLDRAVAAACAGDTSSGELLDIETALTLVAIRAAGELLRGRVSAEEVDVSWHAVARTRDVAAVLADAVDRGAPARALEAMDPPHAGYRALVEKLARLRDVAAAGGWIDVPGGPILEPGDAADTDRLVALRARLVGGECLDPNAPCPVPDAYDAALVAAVRRFQRQHGLVVDGIVGPITMAALRVTAAQRARQVAWNLDRWRWVPDDLGSRHVSVNVPAAELAFVAGETSVARMRVIVGREGWGTPAFSDAIETVVLNPYWNVPTSLAAREIVPKARRDPAAHAAQGFELVAWDGRVVSLTEVDASRWLTDHWLRQRPGEGNALGHVKLLFPNRFNVYLHDTPARNLFARDQRALSHGCIRVERPRELAELVIEAGSPLDGPWDRARLDEAIAAGEEREIYLRRAVPVHLLYFTAAVDDAGELRFHPDIYGFDARHEAAWERRREAALAGPS